jgi:hypothetical protein
MLIMLALGVEVGQREGWRKGGREKVERRQQECGWIARF